MHLITNKVSSPTLIETVEVLFCVSMVYFQLYFSLFITIFFNNVFNINFVF